MLREWQKRRREKEGDGGGGVKQKVRCHFLFLCFRSSHVTTTWRLKGKQKRKLAVERKSGSLWGENVQQQLRPGLSPAPAQPPLRTVLHTHTRAYIFIVSTKPSLYQGPFAFRCLEPRLEIRNIHSRNVSLTVCCLQCVLLQLRVHSCACLFPYKSARMFMCALGILSSPWSHFETPSGLEVSVSALSVALLSSTGGLSDWWTDGSLVGMKVAVGTEGWATSREESHMHAPITPTNTHGVKTKGWGRVCVCKTERKALCLGRAVPNVPWGFGAISCPHKQWDTQTQTHTHSTGYSLCPATRIRWKKAWHVVRDGEGQNKDKQREISTIPLQRAFTNGCSRVL